MPFVGAISFGSHLICITRWYLLDLSTWIWSRLLEVSPNPWVYCTRPKSWVHGDHWLQRVPLLLWQCVAGKRGKPWGFATFNWLSQWSTLTSWPLVGNEGMNLQYKYQCKGWFPHSLLRASQLNLFGVTYLVGTCFWNLYFIGPLAE